MTEAMFDYCIRELQHRAASRGDHSTHGPVYVLPRDVYRSDAAISEETKLASQRAVRPLENRRRRADGMTLDLVDPSLYPLIYGSTKILPLGARQTTLKDCIERCGEDEVVEAVLKPLKITTYLGATFSESPDQSYSSKFQWLPCEVDTRRGKHGVL